jgi:hypothetical protein
MSKIFSLMRRHCLCLWLERGVWNRVRAARGHGESYSDVILPLAQEEVA